MTQDEIRRWVNDSDTLAEFIEKADENDISADTQAMELLEAAWERDIPRERAIDIIQKERERVSSYQEVSLSHSSRAPRYMDLSDLELLSGHEFEYILAEILCQVEGDATVTEGSGDQGVDVVWFRDDEVVGIQAKAYQSSNRVSNSAVQEIYTGSRVRKSEYSIDVPAVVTTSHYTAGAREAAKNPEVRLYDRSDLNEWLEDADLTAGEMGEALDRMT
jgi:hypothetical protein